MTPMLHSAWGWTLLVPDGSVEHLCEEAHARSVLRPCGCEALAHRLLLYLGGVTGIAASDLAKGLARSA